MSGIAHQAIFHVNRVTVEFADDIGNMITIRGTGFWIQRGIDKYFVTNAHNIDPRHKLGADTKMKFYRMSLCLRMQFVNRWTHQTQETFMISPKIVFSPDADVAVIKNPIFQSSPANFTYSCFLYDDVATDSFLSTSLSAMDIASFIGFPGNKGVVWYDELWNLAIARTVNISSMPGMPFTNKIIPTADTMLVSGLSFSGSSGSPVISHQKGIQVGPGLTGGIYAPPKLIGIMSGHWHEGSNSKDPLQHSGLSYLTRSTSILSLLV